MSFLYKSDPVRGAIWARLFTENAPDIPFFSWPNFGDPAKIRYLAAWQPPDKLATQFPNLDIVFSIGAGIDQFDFSTIPKHVRIARMIEPGIAAGMVEYVAHAVLSVHLQSSLYAQQQDRKIWRAHETRRAPSSRIGVMGLGVLGQSVLRRLGSFGFQCAGWSRSAHSIEGVTCYSGDRERRPFLESVDILICLLPLTDSTRGILNEELFDALPKGAAIINVGRGGHLRNADLLAALDSGHLSAAILDVCEPEPLPSQHPFWDHPKITLTPHIASLTQPETAAMVTLDNIRRHQRGEPLSGLIDRALGY
jgi:glyoxylate/hydroxypyruvate reductase A